MVDPEIAKIIESVEYIQASPDDHKDYEGYNEGWVDACNTIINLLTNG